MTTSPIENDFRLWMEQAFLWLIQEFGEEKIKTRKVFLPTQEDFPITYNGFEKAAFDTLSIVANAMEINSDEIQLDFFDGGIQEFNMDMGNIIFTQQDESEQNAAGLYFGKNENGKYDVALDRGLLKQPARLVSTLTHEFAHIKLLGEKRIEENDEYLTDLVPIIFGFGIFNANTAFEFNQSYDRWSHSRLGYLSQMDWGYALALFAYIRYEESPEWINHLTKNIKSDFLKSETFINENQDKIFKEEYNSR